MDAPKNGTAPDSADLALTTLTNANPTETTSQKSEKVSVLNILKSCWSVSITSSNVWFCLFGLFVLLFIYLEPKSGWFSRWFTSKPKETPEDQYEQTKPALMVIMLLLNTTMTTTTPDVTSKHQSCSVMLITS